MRDYNIRLRRRLLVWAFGLLALGIALISVSGNAPEPLRRYVVYAGFVAMAAGSIVIHFLPK